MKLVKRLFLLAISLVLGVTVYAYYQYAQAARPDYDHPSASAPLGKPQPPISRAGEVAAVIDGNTITLQSGEQIRLCGITAPDLSQPLGKQAAEGLRSRLAKAGNQVIVWTSEQDRAGRTLAEVFVSAGNPQQPEEETFVNYELVAAGLAYHERRLSDRCPGGSELLVQAEDAAKGKRLGVWATLGSGKSGERVL